MYVSRFFVFCSGITSAFVSLYVVAAYSVAAFMLATLPTTPGGYIDSTFFRHGLVIAMHVVACIGGGILGLLLLIHALRNPRISPVRRQAWGLGIIFGFCQFPYWWCYIRSRAPQSIAPATAPGG
jgi:hypothetical protein